MAASSAADTTYVLGGTYYLNGNGLSLTGANSNDTIAAYQGANAVISGGSLLPTTGWTVGSDGIWSAHLNASNIEQLTLNGQSQTEARYPNEVPTNPIQGGWLWAKTLPSGDNPSTQMAYNKADFPAGQPPTVGEKVTVFSASDYTNQVLTITNVDTTAGVITFDQPADSSIGPGSRYFISDSKVLLDQPGEWYFDPASHTLYFKPPAGFDGSGAVASGDLSPINISGAQNITISGLTIADAATTSETQSINTAAINIVNSNGIVVDSNHFTNVAQGVFISGTSSHNTISNNDFSHVWSAAVTLEYGTSNNLVTNNSITNSNEVFVGLGAIFMDESLGNTISHNLIQNVSGAGISEVNYNPSKSSGGNTIEYNSILHSGQQTNDVGAIYAYSGPDLNALGDIIRYNNIVDTGGLGTTASGFIAGQYLSAGVYLDNLVSNAQVYGNFIQGTGYAGVQVHGGNNDNVWGNIIVGDQGQGVRLDAIDANSMAGDQVHGNIIQVNSDPNIDTISSASGTPLTAIPSTVYQNIYYSPSGISLHIEGKTFSQWQAAGGDLGSVVTTNPGFVNPPSNYSLIPGSLALTDGFTNLPWAQMGLLGTGNPVDTTAPVARPSPRSRPTAARWATASPTTTR